MRFPTENIIIQKQKISAQDQQRCRDIYIEHIRKNRKEPRKEQEYWGSLASLGIDINQYPVAYSTLEGPEWDERCRRCKEGVEICKRIFPEERMHTNFIWFFGGCTPLDVWLKVVSVGLAEAQSMEWEGFTFSAANVATPMFYTAINALEAVRLALIETGIAKIDE